MKEEIDQLKIKREIILIKNRIKNNVIDKKNTEFLKDIKNSDILKKDIKLLINYYNVIDNIIITQFSVFGFTINYKIFHKNELLLEFDEKMLPKNHNRKTMDDLILSITNRIRHKKFKVKDEIYELSNIDY